MSEQDEKRASRSLSDGLALDDTALSVGEPPAAAQPAAAPSLVDSTLQHYRVLALLGQGGMGSVYRAHDLSLDRPVALKVIAPGAVQESTARERFLREARAQARLNHPNVVPIYYIGEQDGLIFFAMECVEGSTLDAPLQQGERLAPARAIEHLIAIVNALELAHERGIVHRDLKPSNLILDRSGQVKITDFGLSKGVDGDAQLTQEGTILGSPLYMSPEQGQGEPTDFRSDIYSLGATFYHLVTGQPPFTAGTPMGVITKHITQPLPAVRSVASEVPAELAVILERMLAKNPVQRYQSYAELRAALEAARPQAMAPAGLWVRGFALGIDTLLLFITFSIVGRVAWLLYPLYIVAGWWRYGQTLGKWLFNLRVRTLDGRLPSLRRSMLRYLVLNWGALPMCLVLLVHRLCLGSWWLSWHAQHVTGFRELWRVDWAPVLFLAAYAVVVLVYAASLAWTGFRRDRRALHDHASGTKVVYAIEQ